MSVSLFLPVPNSGCNKCEPAATTLNWGLTWIVEHLAAGQYCSGKPCILALMWMSRHTNHLLQHEDRRGTLRMTPALWPWSWSRMSADNCVNHQWRYFVLFCLVFLVGTLFLLFTYLNKLKHRTFMTLVIKLVCSKTSSSPQSCSSYLPVFICGMNWWYVVSNLSPKQLLVLFFSVQAQSA